MSWWSGTGREDYWEAQVKRPNEEAIICPNCSYYAKRQRGSDKPYLCTNCKWEGQSTQTSSRVIEP